MGSRGPAPEGESSKSCSTRWESGAWWLRQRPELQVTLRSHIMTTHPRTLKQTIRTKPLIGTAFSAALFGGLLSPAITYGFERMSEYEIKWPEFTRKTSSKSGKSRALQFSWLDTLEAVGKIVSKLESVQ